MGFLTFFYITFFLVFGIIIYNLLQGVIEWDRNNKSPEISAEAKIVDKRCHTTHHRNASSSSYYVTFEFPNGERTELRVPRGEYGLLVEGDVGVLSYKGTRYLSFERRIRD